LRTCIVEAEGPGNRGAFLVARLDGGTEWVRISLLSGTGMPLLAELGYEAHPPPVLLCDLRTGEAAVFMPPKRSPAYTDEQWANLAWISASNDAAERNIGGPLFAPFLAWLYTYDSIDLPLRVELDAPFALRRPRRIIRPKAKHLRPITGDS
jgi:hypothetical protein